MCWFGSVPIFLLVKIRTDPETVVFVKKISSRRLLYSKAKLFSDKINIKNLLLLFF